MEILEMKIKDKIGNNTSIACKEALNIANSLKISPTEVGEELNRINVKIKGCQLGCFKQLIGVKIINYFIFPVSGNYFNRTNDIGNIQY